MLFGCKHCNLGRKQPATQAGPQSLLSLERILRACCRGEFCFNLENGRLSSTASQVLFDPLCLFCFKLSVPWTRVLPDTVHETCRPRTFPTCKLTCLTCLSGGSVQRKWDPAGVWMVNCCCPGSALDPDQAPTLNLLTQFHCYSLGFCRSSSYTHKHVRGGEPGLFLAKLLSRWDSERGAPSPEMNSIWQNFETTFAVT